MRKSREEINIKIIKYAIIALAILTIIVFGTLMYSKKLNQNIKAETLTGKEEISNIMNNINSSKENTASASSSIGKNVDEASNELNNSSSKNSSSNAETNGKNLNILTTNNIKNNSATSETNSAVSSLNTDNKEPNKTEQTANNQAVQNSELKFEKPVEGEVVKEFAMDNLVYSNTLGEWTVHTGIDIKADKTTVVKSAEAGTVKTIKNDPRYGLTIVVEHTDGFQTVYSNLLTSEFVIEGEKVEKGQALGTVGNTAAFEIADEPHLHFEILKDSVQVNPNIYIK